MVATMVSFILMYCLYEVKGYRDWEAFVGELGHKQSKTKKTRFLHFKNSQISGRTFYNQIKINIFDLERFAVPSRGS